ncbi:MAG: hypothetical protein BRD30_02585 [Bacteroidetes bacterium QH_2_63_10]|nr:MAG: hypothetical protein BRD30_02585 [Bacteroidetes bacterium QH_2_63_10]
MKSLAHTGDSGEEHARRPSVRSRLIPRVGAAAVLPVVLGLFVVVGCTSSDSTATGEAAADTAAAAADTSTDTLSLDALADTLAPAEAARYAYHGRDRDGKDGPLSKIGYDLARLYFAYRAHQRQASGQPFASPGGVSVTGGGRVVVDATARRDSRQLRADLDALGLEGGATAGPIVSGRLPIEALAEAAALESLRSLRPSVAQTQ